MRWRKTNTLAADSTGFTIIEVLIVLAVTGAMFVSVALVISGKQQTAQFQTAMNEVRTQIQQVGNEVVSGYFPNDGSYDCNPATGKIVLQPKNVANPSSGKCNFIGKAMHFYTGSSNDHFSTYSILGIDDTTGSYATAKPFLVAKVNLAARNANDYDVTVNTRLGYGLQINKMTYQANTPGAPVKDIGSFAFVQSLNNSGDLARGGSSQYLDVLAFTAGSSLTKNERDEATAIDQAFESGAYGAPGGTISLCFNSGSTDQHGEVLIGSAASKFDITSKIGNGSC